MPRTHAVQAMSAPELSPRQGRLSATATSNAGDSDAPPTPPASTHPTNPASVSRTGFRGDLDPRMLSWGEEILRCYVETEEVPRGAARAWCAVGARERPAARARRC